MSISPKNILILASAMLAIILTTAMVFSLIFFIIKAPVITDFYIDTEYTPYAGYYHNITYIVKAFTKYGMDRTFLITTNHREATAYLVFMKNIYDPGHGKEMAPPPKDIPDTPPPMPEKKKGDTSV